MELWLQADYPEIAITWKVISKQKDGSSGYKSYYLKLASKKREYACTSYLQPWRYNSPAP